MSFSVKLAATQEDNLLRFEAAIVGTSTGRSSSPLLRCSFSIEGCGLMEVSLTKFGEVAKQKKFLYPLHSGMAYHV